MNRAKDEILDQIKNLFDSQSLAVLATQKNDQPYASLVLFAATPILNRFQTRRQPPWSALPWTGMFWSTSSRTWWRFR